MFKWSRSRGHSSSEHTHTSHKLSSERSASKSRERERTTHRRYVESDTPSDTETGLERHREVYIREEGSRKEKVLITVASLARPQLFAPDLGAGRCEEEERIPRGAAASTMSGNGGGSRNAAATASIAAAAAAVGAGTAGPRFPSRHGRRIRWGGCWRGFSCFRSQKRATRIVPSSRVLEGSAAPNPGNGSQPHGLSIQSTTLAPALLAPPSSPASFSNSNSALPSTAPSPNCFPSLSANSPGEPSSTMFAIGPYAHETQLVSPPVFSAYTTEPSTAPLTPPPELAHLTTPSSPDVPFAHYLSSSFDMKRGGKGYSVPFVSTGYTSGSDLQKTYPLYTESPSSSMVSSISGTPRTGMSSPILEQEIPSQWGILTSTHDTHARNQSCDRNTSNSKNLMSSRDPGYISPTAQLHPSWASQQSYPSHYPYGGRRSFSMEADIHSSPGYKHNKSCNQDVEELEAYRASFGFSADELIAAPSYVEIPDEVDISFSVPPFGHDNRLSEDQYPFSKTLDGSCFWNLKKSKSSSKRAVTEFDIKKQEQDHAHPELALLSGNAFLANGSNDHHSSKDEILLSKICEARGSRSFHLLSSSDAEVDYRRSRSLKNVDLSL